MTDKLSTEVEMSDIKTDAIRRCITGYGYIRLDSDSSELSQTALGGEAESELAALLQRNKEQEEQVAVMRGALGFYADKNNWMPGMTHATGCNAFGGGTCNCEGAWEDCDAVIDDGERARSATTPDTGKRVVDVETKETIWKSK